MTITPAELPRAVDVRRAAALLMHADPDGIHVAGVEAVLAEVDHDGRTTELYLALCSLIYGIHPDLSSADGKAGLTGIITNFALAENGEHTHE